MKKTVVMLLIVSLAIVGGSCQKSVTKDYDRDIAALQDSITALRADLESVSAALAATNANVTGLGKSIDSIKINLAFIMTKMTDLTQQLAAANADIASIKSQLAVLTQMYQDLQGALTTLLGQLNAPPISITRSLLAYYPFNGNLKDSSGHGYDLTSVGTVTYIQDHSGQASQAYNLGNSRAYSNAGYFNFQRTDSFTISFWFKQYASTSGGRLLSTECPEGNFRISSYQNGAYAFSYGSAANYIYDTIQNNVWNHIIYMYSNRTIKIYKNGIQIHCGPDADTEALNYCGTFMVGAKAASAFDMWSGAIDELRVYGRTLTLAELAYLTTH